MKRIITLAILTLCASAAFAEKTQTPAEFTQELRNYNDYDSGFIAGVINSDPKVCVGSTVSVNTAISTVADVFQALYVKDSKFSQEQLTWGDEEILVIKVLESAYSCK
jgi:hypothetical protein